ncbi:MAG: CusA/CzcA family heavy metal efflux RND transporter [Ignavibacteriales bacterium]|nr:CusA/CzcA family heavy metal efflux RND transporter [Ignavibacteriales bacterium]
MLEQIVALTLRQKGFVLLCVGALVLVGVFAGVRLPIDALPDVTNVQVEIVSTAPGLSPLEIERFVTSPIEMAMRGLPDVAQLRSVTKFGLSVVTIVFHDDVDTYFARQLVFQRLEDAKAKVPSSVTVEMGPIATALGEIYQYTLEGTMPPDSLGRVNYLSDLRTLQDWVVAPMLKSVSGVNDINSFGGYFKQYQVVVSPGRLLQHDLALEKVYEALEKNNQNVGGNVLNRHSEQLIVRGVGMLRTEDDIRNVVLKSERGTPIFVKDVAEVRIGEAVRQGASVKNGKDEVVGGIVLMLKGKNSREIVQAVKSKVRDINEGNLLPAGIKLVPYYDRTDIVERSVSTVTGALIEGAVIVLVILYILLRSARSALIVVVAFPLSLLFTCIVMKYGGMSANLMSLGGLAISIGMIIDATIIQVENVQRNLGSVIGREPKLTTVLKSVLEVQKPSILGELIIAMTFLPILSLEGMEGKMFQPLALTVAIAVLASLLLSVFVIPVLCLVFLKPGSEKESPVLRPIKGWYKAVLSWSLGNKRTVLAIAGGSLVLAAILTTRLGTEFIPIMDEGAFDMDIQLLPSVSLEKSMEINQLIQQKIKAFPELETLVSRTGQTGIAVEARGVDKTGYTGIFKKKSEWTTASTKEEIIEKMRGSLAGIPGIAFSFSQPIQCRIDELVAGTKAQLIVKLFGENIEILKARADEIASTLSRVRGATDIVVERVAGQPYLTVAVDRSKLARHGLNASDVLNVMEIAVGGKAATQLYEENRAFDVTLRYPEENRNSAANIGDILVACPDGYNVPLDELATIEVVDGPVQVSREDGLRRIGIELNVKGRDIGSFVSEAKNAIRRAVVLPPGYYATWGGQFENQERAMKRLMVIVPLTIAMIFVLLFFTFRSLRLASLVIFNLPFALIGGVLALYVSRLYLSVPASVGFIVLFGVAVLNGVVLVSRIMQLRQKGMAVSEAITAGCQDRLRPVLLTASISIFSLIPMLYASGPGSEIQHPLAVVVVGGLITSTLLTLIVIPTLYEWFEGGREEQGEPIVKGLN